MQQLGCMSAHGHSVDDLRSMRESAEAMAAAQGLTISTELHHLAFALLPNELDEARSMSNFPSLSKDEEAYVLVIRKGASLLLGASDSNSNVAMAAYEKELAGLDVDKQALMRGRVVNKHARWNVCFDSNPQKANIAAGQGTVVAFESVPCTLRMRNNLSRLHPSLANIKAEYNDYYDVNKCGIGYHGDSERREVVAVRAGASMPIYFQWFHRSRPFGARLCIPLQGGDLYVMSEKAVGTDWKRSSQLTLRHATGCDKYTVIKLPSKSSASAGSCSSSSSGDGGGGGGGGCKWVRPTKHATALVAGSMEGPSSSSQPSSSSSSTAAAAAAVVSSGKEEVVLVLVDEGEASVEMEEGKKRKKREEEEEKKEEENMEDDEGQEEDGQARKKHLMDLEEESECVCVCEDSKASESG